MQLVKKLVFAIPFLACFSLMLFLFKDFSANPANILSLNLNIFYSLISFLSFTILAGLFFCLFVSFAREIKLVGPVILSSLVITFLSFPNINSPVIIFMVGFLITEFLIYLILDNTLKTYINFSPTQIFLPVIKKFTQFTLLTLSIGLFILFNIFYQTNKFEIPDSLIDMALKSIPQTMTTSDQGESFSLPSKLDITPEQINTLKQNPKLLEQFGLSVSDLEALSKSTIIQTEDTNKQIPLDQRLIRTAVKNQVNQMIEPYAQFIPLILAGLFFLSLYSINSLLLVFILPIIWLIFKILEGTNFVTYTKEMREVKKLII